MKQFNREDAKDAKKIVKRFDSNNLALSGEKDTCTKKKS
jgi:hypothetical protein